MESLLSKLQETLSTQFILEGCFSSVDRASEHVIFCIAKKMTTDNYTEQEVNNLTEFCEQLNDLTNKRPLSIETYLKVDEILDKIKVITGLIISDLE